MAVLGYLAKSKRSRLGLAFGAYFLHDFSIKILYQWAKFHCHNISFSRYKTKCVKFLFRQLMTSYILRFFLDQPLKQWLAGKKRGEDENTKI